MDAARFGLPGLGSDGNAKSEAIGNEVRSIEGQTGSVVLKHVCHNVRRLTRQSRSSVPPHSWSYYERHTQQYRDGIKYNVQTSSVTPALNFVNAQNDCKLRARPQRMVIHLHSLLVQPQYE